MSVIGSGVLSGILKGENARLAYWPSHNKPREVMSFMYFPFVIVAR
jgi:hypothetical protein